jgi:small subunit ribosomal protein S6
MRDYEAMLVLQPTLDDEGVNGVVNLVGELVGRGGGTVASAGQLVDKRGNVAEVTEGWRTRRLAYTIDGKRDGYFVVLRLQAPPESIGELERALHINENILRHMVLRADAPAA